MLIFLLKKCIKMITCRPRQKKFRPSEFHRLSVHSIVGSSGFSGAKNWHMKLKKCARKNMEVKFRITLFPSLNYASNNGHGYKIDKSLVTRESTSALIRVGKLIRFFEIDMYGRNCNIHFLHV